MEDKVRSYEPVFGHLRPPGSCVPESFSGQLFIIAHIVNTV